jgi:hypothetical protein
MAFTVSTETFMDGTHLSYEAWLKAFDLVWADHGADLAKDLSIPRGQLPVKTTLCMRKRIVEAIELGYLSKAPDGWSIRADPDRYSRKAKGLCRRAAEKSRRLDGDYDTWTEEDRQEFNDALEEEFGDPDCLV